MTDCVFCKIVKGDIPCSKIYEDDHYLAFLDINQLVPGHTLIIPKQHFGFVWDVPGIGEYFEFTRKVADHYRSIGYKFVDSSILGQMVPHAHIHLLPHNDNHPAYKKAVAGLEAISRPISPESATALVAKLKLSE